MLHQDGWQSMTPWYAAQLVQRSAFTERPTASNGGSAVVGDNYRRQATRAAAVLSVIEGDSSTLDCCAAASDAFGEWGDEVLTRR